MSLHLCFGIRFLHQPTKDQVFLLSISEAKKYINFNDALQCQPTHYAVSNGANVDFANGNCYWWLRTPGNYQNYAVGVNSDGSIGFGGSCVNNKCVAVRPAMWVDTIFFE